MVQVSDFYPHVDLLSPQIVPSAMVHLRWEGHFGLIPSTIIPSWSWYVFMRRLLMLLSYLPACFPHSTITCLFQVKQELTHNEALYKSSRRLFGLVSSCLQELPFPWYVMIKVVFLVQSNFRFLDDARFRPVHVLVSIFQVIRC
jgi:hypothetical protein